MMNTSSLIGHDLYLLKRTVGKNHISYFFSHSTSCFYSRIEIILTKIHILNETKLLQPGLFVTQSWFHSAKILTFSLKVRNITPRSQASELLINCTRISPTPTRKSLSPHPKIGHWKLCYGKNINS